MTTIETTKDELLATLTAEFLTDAPADATDEITEVIEKLVAEAVGHRGTFRTYSDYLDAEVVATA